MDKGNKQVNDWAGKFTTSKTDGLISKMYKELEVKKTRSATEYGQRKEQRDYRRENTND